MTFGELQVGTRFVTKESPASVKIKTGFQRWKWADHVGFLPVAHRYDASREVTQIQPATEERTMNGDQLLSWYCDSCKKYGSVFFPISGEEWKAVEAQRADHHDRSPKCLAVLTHSHFGTGGQSRFEEQKRITIDEFFNTESI